MLHEIEDGPITVVKVINPCFYWVRCSKCVRPVEMSAGLKGCTLSQHDELKHGEKVLMIFFDKHLYRSVVQDRVSKQGSFPNSYELFMIDTLATIEASRDTIFAVDKEVSNSQSINWMNIPPQLHIIGLERASPVENSDYLKDLNYGVSSEEYRLNRILKILKSADWLEFKKKSITENVVFGKIRCGKDSSRLNLLSILTEEGFAHYSPDFMNILQMNGWMDSILSEIDMPKNKMNPPALKEADSVQKESLYLTLPSPPEFKVNPAVIDELNRGMDRENAVETILPILRFETFDEFNDRMRIVSNILVKNQASGARTKKINPIENDYSKVGNGSNTSDNGYKDSHCDSDSISSYVLSSSDCDSVPSNSKKKVNHRLTDKFLIDENSKRSIQSNCIEKEKSVSLDVSNDSSAPQMSIESSQLQKLKNKLVAAREIPVTKSRIFGRGKLILESEAKIKLSSNESLICTDDRKCHSIEQRRDNVYGFSDSDYADSFLDDTSDSDCYAEVLRMNRSRNDTVIISTDLPSPLKEVHKEISCHHVPYELEKSTSITDSTSESVNGCDQSNYLTKNQVSGNSKDPMRGLDNRIPGLQWGKENRGVPLRVAGRGKLFELFNRSSTVDKCISSNSSICSSEGKCSSPSIPSLGRGRLLRKKPSARYNSTATENQKLIQFADSNVAQRRKCSFDKQFEAVSSKISEQPTAQILNDGISKLNPTSLPSTEVSSSVSNRKGHPMQTPFGSSINRFTGYTTESESIASVKTSSISESEADLSIGTYHSLSDLSIVKLSEVSKSGAGILLGANEILAERFASLDLNEFIYKNVRKFGYLTRPQQFAMPVILKRRNVVLISSNQTKKSTACVLPILNLLMDKDYYAALRKGNGPRCVMVAPSSDRVKKLSLLCSRLSGSSLSVISTYGGGLELERKNELSSGCDILITTPRCWLRLLEYPVVTNMSRLCHLILDRFDILSELFPHELQSISSMVKDGMKIRAMKNDKLKELNVQTVVSAQQWSPAIEKMITKVLKSPVLIFTNYLEAVLYAGIKPTVVVLKPEVKMERLLDILQKNKPKKIVVVCATANEVCEVRTICTAASLNTIVAHEKMPKSLLSGVPGLWKSAKYQILVCTDALISELNVTDAEVLLHFSLPLSKTSFNERFVVFRDSVPDKLINPQVKSLDCPVFILIDEMYDAPFPFIVEFLKRILSKVPHKILISAKAISRKKEKSKTGVPFCENLLQRGDCCRMVSCRDRHVILPEIDKPKRAFINKGYLKIQIVNVHSAVKYSVRILGYSSTLRNSSWTTPKSDFMFLSVKMASYFASHSNRRLHGCPKVGDVPAYQESIDQPFHRARIVEIVDKNEREEPTLVRLFLIDNGLEIEEAMTCTLFELPEEFKNYPDQIVFVYLGKLMPVDLDTAWSYAAKKVVERAIHKREIEDDGSVEIVAKVLFSIRDNFVVNNLLWCKRLKHSVCFELDLRRLILQSGCGIDSPTYMKNLYQIYEESDFLEGMFNQEESSNEEMVHPAELNRQWDQLRWAHLSWEEEYSLVEVSSAESPSLFYVKLIAFHERLLELQNDLKSVIVASNSHLNSPSVGDVCAVENPKEPGTWNRGLIVQVNNNSAEIFYVDHGDKAWLPKIKLYGIPWKFVIRIPFQAIECQLSGVRPNDESFGWSNLAVDAFQNFTASTKDIYAKAVDFDLKGHRTRGKRYHVILSSFENDQPILLNKKFVVNLGFGAWELKEGLDEGELIEAIKVFRQKTTDRINEQEPNNEMSEVSVDDSDSNEEDWDGNASSIVTSEPHNVVQIQNENFVANEESNMNFQWDNVDEEDFKDFVMALFPALQNVSGPHKSSKKSSELMEKPASPCQEICHQEESESQEITTNVAYHNSNTTASNDTCIENQASQKKNELDISDELPNLVYVHKFKTPTVHWRQDLHTVTIAYMIPGIKYYQFHPYSSCICLNAIVKTVNENDEYWSRIPLFGPVLENVVSETLSLTSVRITLMKTIQGYLWPRLTYLKVNDGRIKLDPQVSDPFDIEPPSPIIDQLFERGWKSCERRGWNKSDRQLVNYSVDCLPEECDEDDDMDDSHYYEKLPDELPDEFNPFS